MDDEQIIALYLDRDESALKETERKYSAYLGKIAYNILANSEDSEECVNDTYMRAWETIPPNIPPKLAYYLGKITRELSIDRFRRRKSKKRCDSEYALSIDELEGCVSDSDDPEAHVDVKILSGCINAFLAECSDDARNIFICRYYYCDSVKQIASYLGMSESKVKSALFRTRNSLKDYLKKEGFFV